MRKDQDGMHPKSGRQRALNVIYFIDAHKTRSFHLSLNKVVIILGVVILLTSWSIASMYVVARFVEQRDALNDRLHTALATIFEYQSRYDGVYESAYPEIQVKTEQVVASQDANASKEASPAAGVEDNKDSQPVAFQQDINNLDQETLIAESSNPNWPIAIEDLSMHRDQDELEVSFAIRNKLSPSRSEGYIWAVATLLDGTGKQIHLGSPPGIAVDENGAASNPNKNANWYSIRYYKAKSFYFTLPSKWAGKITQLGISMMDTSGHQSTFHVPLLKRLGDRGKPQGETQDGTQMARKATPQTSKSN